MNQPLNIRNSRNMIRIKNMHNFVIVIKFYVPQRSCKSSHVYGKFPSAVASNKARDFICSGIKYWRGNSKRAKTQVKIYQKTVPSHYINQKSANLINPTGNIAIVFNFLNSSKRSRE